MIAGCNTVECPRAVCNQPCENVQTTSRAFWIGRRFDIGWQDEPLGQLHDVDTTGFQDRITREIDLVQLEAVELVGNGVLRAWKKGSAHAPRALAQSQIETGRLDLIEIRRLVTKDGACLE